MTGLDGLPLVLFVAVVVFAPVTSWLANRRDRSPGTWFVLGALTGPIAAFIVAIAPPGRCPVCGLAVRGWPTACPGCGTAFDRVGRAPRAVPNPLPVSAPRAPVVAPGVRPAPTPLQGSLAGASRPPTASSLRRDDATHVRDAGEPTDLLATAMYITGSHECQPGLHYLLTLRGGALVVLGPLETAPHTVAATRPVAELRVTAFGEGLLISDARSVRGWSLGFQRFTGGTPASVEQALLVAGAAPGVV
jgi:hypothetical protein